MTRVPYDADHIARFFDRYGAREWDRFDASPMDRVNLESHVRFLREHIRPGRFTLELARLGATVVAGDISPGQPALHAEKTASGTIGSSSTSSEPGALDGGTHIIAALERL